MKKLFCLLLATILVMGLTACGSSQNSGGDDLGDATAGESLEVIAILKINTEGMGTIAYGLEGEAVVFDKDFPNQSTMVNLTEPGTYVIKAKPDDGWKFVKWTRNGEDFSEETDITVEVTEDVEYIAVFDEEGK